jgi:hypothetical protein
MNRIKSNYIVICLVITFILTFGFIGKSFAYQKFRSPGSFRHITPPMIMPPPRPNIFINYKWSPGDIVKAFNENGLEVEKTEPVNKSDYSSLPAKAKEAIKFTVPLIGEEGIGCILSFEVKSNMEEIRKHYLDKNKKEELYSWTFVKDNILIVLNGVISEEKARMFERVLNQLD